MAWYHQVSAKILQKFPWLYEKLTLSVGGAIDDVSLGTPFTRFTENPFEARLMFVTTGGAHCPDHPTFDMSDSRGDTSYRWIPRDQRDFVITHDYYDHSDADDDINCLFPLPLARSLSESDCVGQLTNRHLSFMGHIEDPLVPKLVNERLPTMWDELEDRPELVLLSPG